MRFLILVGISVLVSIPSIVNYLILNDLRNVILKIDNFSPNLKI